MHNHCIATEELQPGMVIVQVTRQNGPLKIRKSGLVSSVEMIQGLIEMGIQEVQIDPTQTVEIESPVTQRSATLTLLQSGSGPQHRQDSQLHDQFNRSLFLPSVQDIPSAWQFYARRYAVLTLLVMCGLALGFAMSYVPAILSLRSPLVIAEPLHTENAETKVSAGENTPPELTQEKVSEGPQQAIAAEAEPEPAQMIQKPLVPVSEPVLKVSETNTLVSTQQQEAVLQPETPAESQISPELLRRFESVIKQMDKEDASKDLYSNPRDNFSQAETSVQRMPALTPPAHQSGAQDVPRLDQLPVWVINELPSMAFSVHMFASDPAERWVRVNGQRKQEGDLIDNKVSIVQIASQHVILNYQGHEFSMLAMTDW